MVPLLLGVCWGEFLQGETEASRSVRGGDGAAGVAAGVRAEPPWFVSFRPRCQEDAKLGPVTCLSQTGLLPHRGSGMSREPGRPGAGPKAGSGGGTLGGEGTCPAAQPRNLSPPRGTEIPRGSHPSPAWGKLRASKSLQMLLAPFLLHVLILLGCCGSPCPGSGARIPGGPRPVPPFPFHHRLPSPSFADRHSWG